MESSQNPFSWSADGMTPNTSGRYKSLKERNDSLKLIEKQSNAFRVFRVTNAFIRKPKLDSESLHAQKGASVVSDNAGPLPADDAINNEQLQKVQSFVNYVNQKFSFVTNQTPDASFVTNDYYYMDTLPVITEISGTIAEDTSLDAQFRFRNKLYHILIDNNQVFTTLKKLLELHLFRGWMDKESDKEERFTMRFLCASLVVFLVNGTDCHQGFGEALCNESGLLEILVFFIREKKNATQENTRHDEVGCSRAGFVSLPREIKIPKCRL
jgi:hypothetical protein